MMRTVIGDGSMVAETRMTQYGIIFEFELRFEL
jgi:hypothetical protein